MDVLRRRNLGLVAGVLAVFLVSCAETLAPEASPTMTSSPSAAEPTESATPTASAPAATASASPSATESVSPESGTTDRQFSVAESFGREGWNTEVVDVEYWNGSFLAIAVSRPITSADVELTLWSSSDGREWTADALSLPDTPTSLSQIVPLGDGRLALFGERLDPITAGGTLFSAVWVSENLTDWERTGLGLPDPAAVPRLVAHGPKGYVAAFVNVMSFSPDGVSWQRTEDRSATTLHAGDEGFVVTEFATPVEVQVSASADGVTWYQGDTLSSFALTVAGVGGGDWVAVAGETGLPVWTSADGLTWTEVTSVAELSGLNTGAGLDAAVTHAPLVTVGDEVYMTFAWNHCCAQLSGSRGVVVSTDGVEWSRLDFGDGVVQGGASDGDIVVLGGLQHRGAEGVLWVSD